MSKASEQIKITDTITGDTVTVDRDREDIVHALTQWFPSDLPEIVDAVAGLADDICRDEWTPGTQAYLAVRVDPV